MKMFSLETVCQGSTDLCKWDVNGLSFSVKEVFSDQMVQEICNDMKAIMFLLQRSYINVS